MPRMRNYTNVCVSGYMCVGKQSLLFLRFCSAGKLGLVRVRDSCVWFLASALDRVSHSGPVAHMQAGAGKHLGVLCLTLSSFWILVFLQVCSEDWRYL